MAKYRIDIAGMTEIGPTRDQDQDAILINGITGVKTGVRINWSGELDCPVTVAVVDGMGGYTGGADAAALVAALLANETITDDEEAMDALLTFISERVHQAGEAWGMPRMGATFVAATFSEDGVDLVNAGDCRLYQLRGEYLGLMSQDDRSNPTSPAVSQALGPSRRISSHAYHIDYEGEHERFLLCCDGVWGTISNEELTALCQSDKTPGEIVGEISKRIYELEASDNCSAVVVDVVFGSVAN